MNAPLPSDPMMQPCRRGCGELVHLENDGFHVCRELRTSNEQIPAPSNHCGVCGEPHAEKTCPYEELVPAPAARTSNLATRLEALANSLERRNGNHFTDAQLVREAMLALSGASAVETKAVVCGVCEVPMTEVSPGMFQHTGECLCEGCPPVGYPTDKTRCLPCPRRAQKASGESGWPLPSDCSGDPTSCPDNEGTGCFCSRSLSARNCTRSHPHENMTADECRWLTEIARRQVNGGEKHE
jgi:hypothetical protein